MPAEVSNPVAKDRYQILIEGQGVSAESFPRFVPGAATLLSTGVMQASLVPVVAGVAITNVCVEMTVAGAGQTLVRVALYSPIAAGVLLASSSDQKALFTAAGPRRVDVPLSAAYTPAANGVVFAAILSVGGTQPTLWRGAGAAAGHITSGVNAWTQQAGLGDLPDPATFVAAGNAFWFGWN